MQRNNHWKRFSTLGGWMTKVVFSLVAIALIWQSSLFSDISATAAPSMFIAANTADHLQNAADDLRDRSKDLIRDSKRNVEKTANRNASKVEQADEKGSFVERKAQRDRDRIARRAEDHAARTERAVDDSVDSAKGLIENIKDAFSK